MVPTFAARLRGLANGFWLLPGAIALAFAVLAEVLVAVDRELSADAPAFTFDGDAGAARGVLETVAGSVLTVAGLTFSLTVVVLVLVSGQYTPRSVPAFLADRVNQATAGTFIGVFTYCLLVLRTVRDPTEGGAGEFVPQLSITVAVAFAVFAIALLLYFIHHLGVSIQASSIVNRIGTTTLRRIRDLPDRGTDVPEDPAGAPGTVRADAIGYVRHVALEALDGRLEGCEHARIRVVPGDFVTEADALADVWPAAAAEEARAPIRNAVTIGLERDLFQDVLYGLRQLAEIAMKALSPGVNDPSTAESAIGYLRAALEQLAARSLPAALRRGRVVAPLRTFDDYVDGAFTQVSRYAAADPAVVVTLLDALARIAAAARAAGHEERVSLLVRVAEDASALGLERGPTEHDQARIRSALAQVGA